MYGYIPLTLSCKKIMVMLICAQSNLAKIT